MGVFLLKRFCKVQMTSLLKEFQVIELAIRSSLTVVMDHTRLKVGGEVQQYLSTEKQFNESQIRLIADRYI
jgi:hypothetical protein